LTRRHTTWIEPVEAPISLGALDAAICRSSNFRFAWQFYRVTGADLETADSARDVVDLVTLRPENHAFLMNATPPHDPRPVTIERLSPQVVFRADTDGVCALLAQAAADRLGAYSRSLAAASACEVRAVAALFGQVGAFNGFLLDEFGQQPFSSWFDQVAWAWCVVVTWPAVRLAWVGCLTDTD
jgi:hypothetical protein